MSQIQAFQWGDIALSEVVYIDGIPHTTRKAIGEWLGYGEPRKSIDKIIERNSYIEDHSVPVRLTATDGKNYAVQAYHPIGFLLLVMESGQPRAQEMKRAVAEFVWSFAGPQQLTRKEVVTLRNQRLNILAKLDRVTNPFVRNPLVEDLQAVSLQVGAAVPPLTMLNGDDPRQHGLEV